MKTLPWQGSNTLNIYTKTWVAACRVGDVPIELPLKPKMDGVVILNASLPGGSAAPQPGRHRPTRSATGWAVPYVPGGCKGMAGRHSDTPAERSPPALPDWPRLCAGAGFRRDPIENHDYTDDCVHVPVHAGQVARMDAVDGATGGRFGPPGKRRRTCYHFLRTAQSTMTLPSLQTHAVARVDGRSTPLDDSMRSQSFAVNGRPA